MIEGKTKARIIGDGTKLGCLHDFPIGTLVTLSDNDRSKRKGWVDAAGHFQWVHDEDLELLKDE